MQLSFDAADRLVELIHARRGAVAPEEAARVLFALERAPATLAHSLLADVVEGDARIEWRGARVGLADGSGETLIEDAELVVFDLETTGLSASRDRMCEIGAVRVKALEVDETFETLVHPGVALPPTIARLTGLAGRGAPQRASARARGAALPRLHRRRAARCAQRALRRRLPRSRCRAAHRSSCRRTGRRHRVARAAAAAPQERAVLAAPARALLRHVLRAVPPSASRRARDGRDPHRSARARAGARRPHARRGHRARGAACAEAARATLADRRRAHDSRRLPVPRPQRDRALRREGARPAGAASLVLRGRPAAARRRGGARRARARGVARARDRSSRLRSRSCGSSASSVRLPMPGPGDRSASRTSSRVETAGPWSSKPGRFGPISSKRRAQLAARALGELRRRRSRRSASPAPREAEAPRPRPSLRGRGATAGSCRRARGRRRTRRRARSAPR